MKKLTREQINQRLEKLRASGMSGDSYTVTRPAMAMCYSMSMPKSITETRKCDGCGREIRIEFSSHANESILSVEDIARRFREAGLEARVLYACEDCATRFGIRGIELRIKTKDEDVWHSSYPPVNIFDTLQRQMDDMLKHIDDIGKLSADGSGGHAPRSPEDLKSQTTDSFEYGLVLRFLTARGSGALKNEVDRLSYNDIYDSEYTHNAEDAGFIKLQIDRALFKVLGLNIVYGMPEVRENLRCELLTAQRIDDMRECERIVESMERTGKTRLTIWEYEQLADTVCPERRRRNPWD